MNHARKKAVILAFLAILAGSGCGGPGPPPVSSSTQEATVIGIVTIAGKTATGGTISFDPSNINRPDARSRTSEIQKNGSYSITTLVGENLVSVDGPSVPRNNTTVVIQSGENSVPIEVKEPPATSSAAAQPVNRYEGRP